MNRHLFLLLCFSLASTPATVVYADDAPGFSLNDAGPDWQSTAAHRLAGPHLFIDRILRQENGQGRILVVSSSADGSLADFAHRVKLIFAHDAGENLLDGSAAHFGHPGHELHFRLARDGSVFFCELFVFEDDTVRRGLLCAATTAAAPPYTLLSRLYRKDTEVLTLAPYKIKQDAATSFPISFRVLGNRETRRVTHLLVTDADLPDSDPDLHADDEIVAIDGRPSQQFDSVMARESELGRIFLNRQPGDEVRLDLISARTKKPFTVTLRVASFQPWSHR